GALLPMKGVYAPFGEEAARGILLAAGAFGSGGQRAEVYVKDVSTDAAAAGSSIEELSGNVRVAGIVGPLLSPAAREAGLYAQKLSVPLITLSQKEGVTSAGGYVFRNSLTHADQAETIAAYAYKGLGSRKFAVLYPQNNYGAELKELFKEEVRRQGGEVVKELGYVPGTKDFSRELTSLFGITGKERREGRRTIKDFTAAVPADALYIPDYYETVSMIVPYLEYYDIKGVRLLGSNGWNSPRLAALSGKGVEGAVFVDGFFANSQRRGSAEFAERFRAAYGTDPGVLEAQAYDAARVLITAAVEGAGGTGRDGVKDYLRAMKDYSGAAGALSFNEKGAAIKRLFILTVKDGAITEILE
ncbi:MAG: penicillin-binding protein activator, partial [Deltaproteobacteria bacterium]|nr:penicillin-binding protein activator [Deltaproteobacteria bacterium]